MESETIDLGPFRFKLRSNMCRWRYETRYGQTHLTATGRAKGASVVVLREFLKGNPSAKNGLYDFVLQNLSELPNAKENADHFSKNK